jgi:hypothetical protein
MKLEIIFDKEFNALLTEIAWSIGDSIKQAMIDSVKPAMIEQAPVIYATPPIQQPTQATTPQAPIQQSMPNSVPVKMPENLSPAVNQFIGQPPPVQAPQPVAPTVPTQQAPVQAPQAPQAPVQTQVPTYTQQDLALAATQLMDSGKQADVLNLIASFGVQALTQLPQEQFGNFATALRTLGAKI